MGGHRLSNKAVILVPQGDDSFKQYRGLCKALLIPYEGKSPRKAVEEYLSAQGAPILYPDMNGETSTSTPLFHTDFKQLVLSRGKKYSPENISGCLGLDNVLSVNSQTWWAEELFSKEIQPTSVLLTSLFLRRILCADAPFEGTSCFACKKEGAEKRCSVCHHARYCSPLCQKEDWKEHKKFCPLLKMMPHDMDAQILKQYQEKLHQFSTADRFGRYVFSINVLFELINQQYTLERDKRMCNAFKAYIMKIINALYGQDAQACATRTTFKTNTAEGFKEFCLWILKESSETAATFQGDPESK